MIEMEVFVIAIICFFVTTVLGEKYFTKNPPRFSIVPVGVIVFLLFSILGVIAVIFPATVHIVGYIAMVLGTLMCSYTRHRVSQRKG